MNIGEKIKSLRKLLGITQPELANLCGWGNDGGQGRISHYETGKREPSIDDLELIAAALGVSVSSLFDHGLKPAAIKIESIRQLSPAITKKLIPIISSVRAGEWEESIDNLQPGDAEEWLPCPVNHSDKTFAQCSRMPQNSFSEILDHELSWPAIRLSTGALSSLLETIASSK